MPTRAKSARDSTTCTSCLIAGVIVSAVGDELMLHRPGEPIDAAAASVLIGAPLLYLAGNAAYKRIVSEHWPLSNGVGILPLLLLSPLAVHTDRLAAGALSTAVMIVVAVMQTLHPRKIPA